MTIWDGILAEARDDRTLILVSGLIVTAAIVRALAPAEKRRVFGMLALTVLHLALVPAAGWLRADGSPSYRNVRLPCLLFEALAFVAMAGTVLFSALLPRVRLIVPRILRDVITAVASIIACFALASKAGFNLSGLIATSAVLTAVIGFSLQDTLGNIMGGLALQMDNSIQVGDWVKVGDVVGKVSEIRWRYTAIETRNWETMIVPNGVLMKGQVVVLGRRHGQPLQWRRWVWFNVDFRYQPSDVIQAVEDALRARPIERVAADPPPNCILMDLAESYGKYAVRYWLTDLAVDDPTDSQIRTRVYFALQRVGIPLSIPGHAVFLTEDSATRRAEKAKEDLALRLATLKKVDLFNTLSPEDLEKMAAGLRYAPFTKHEVLTRQGAEAHWLYMILDGDVSVRVAVDGEEKEVACLAAGSFFGEMGLMTGEPRSATVVALSDVECYRLDKAVFQEIMKSRAELAEDVAEILAKRKVELQAVKEGLSEAAKKRRIAAAKKDLVDKIRDFFGLEADRRSVG